VDEGPPGLLPFAAGIATVSRRIDTRGLPAGCCADSFSARRSS